MGPDSSMRRTRRVNRPSGVTPSVWPAHHCATCADRNVTWFTAQDPVGSLQVGPNPVAAVRGRSSDWIQAVDVAGVGIDPAAAGIGVDQAGWTPPVTTEENANSELRHRSAHRAPHRPGRPTPRRPESTPVGPGTPATSAPQICQGNRAGPGVNEPQHRAQPHSSSSMQQNVTKGRNTMSHIIIEGNVTTNAEGGRSRSSNRRSRRR